MGYSALAPAKSVLKATKVLIILSLVNYSFDFFSIFIFGTGGFSLDSGAQSYIDFYSGYTRSQGGYSLKFIIDSLITPVSFSALVLGLLYNKHLGRSFRALTIIMYVLVFVIYSFGFGKQKQIADLVIIIGSVYIIHGEFKKRKTISAKTIAIFVVSSLMILLIVGSLVARYASIDIDISNYNLKTSSLYYLDESIFPFSLLPGEVLFPIAIMSFYVGGGFYGLSLALVQASTWSYFLGSSYSVSVLARLAGLPFAYESTYPYKVGVATGWDETKWHTVFSWIASDFTFIGALPFYCMLGLLYGRVWMLSKKTGDPLSALLFVWISIGFAYAPANNQLLHSPGGLFATLVFLALWSRKYMVFSKTVSSQHLA